MTVEDEEITGQARNVKRARTGQHVWAVVTHMRREQAYALLLVGHPVEDPTNHDRQK